MSLVWKDHFCVHENPWSTLYFIFLFFVSEECLYLVKYIEKKIYCLFDKSLAVWHRRQHNKKQLIFHFLLQKKRVCYQIAVMWSMFIKILWSLSVSCHYALSKLWHLKHRIRFEALSPGWCLDFGILHHNMRS